MKPNMFILNRREEPQLPTAAWASFTRADVASLYRVKNIFFLSTLGVWFFLPEEKFLNSWEVIVD